LTEDQAYKLAESINTADGWNVFLSQYPDGVYAPYAKAAREKLEAAAVAPPKPQKQASLPDEPPPPKKVKSVPAADACASVGRVRGLDPNGDNFLSVRTGPGTGFGEIDRLYTGNKVRICSSQGKWLKITYGGGRGWVYGRYVAR
jgi:Bacterial SH3 domain